MKSIYHPRWVLLLLITYSMNTTVDTQPQFTEAELNQFDVIERVLNIDNNEPLAIKLYQKLSTELRERFLEWIADLYGRTFCPTYDFFQTK